ncbi:hypothetical protein ACH4C2_12840 [Streptomyces sp. NPDC018057]|uniref:hypothetical protein n=1 Tax=unclassified Streptomyces TaxID=2593676 RepID=UPI0037B007D8
MSGRALRASGGGPTGKTTLLWAGQLIQNRSDISVEYALGCAAASLFVVNSTKGEVQSLAKKVDELTALVKQLATKGA